MGVGEGSDITLAVINFHMISSLPRVIDIGIFMSSFRNALTGFRGSFLSMLRKEQRVPGIVVLRELWPVPSLCSKYGGCEILALHE